MSVLCPNCKKKIDEGSPKCSFCGFIFEEDYVEEKKDTNNYNIYKTKSCPNCGSRLESEDFFCMKCGYKLVGGYKQKNRNNRKKVLFAMVILLIASGLGGVFGYRQYQRNKEIKLYEECAKEFYTQVNNSTENFDLISSLYAVATENDNVLFDSYLIDYCASLSATEVNEEEERRRKIDKLYEQLSTSECDDKEVEKLSKTVKELYYAYCARYDLLISEDFTSLTFEYLNKDSDNELTKALEDNKKELKGLGMNPEK